MQNEGEELPRAFRNLEWILGKQIIFTCNILQCRFLASTQPNKSESQKEEPKELYFKKGSLVTLTCSYSWEQVQIPLRKYILKNLTKSCYPTPILLPKALGDKQESLYFSQTGYLSWCEGKKQAMKELQLVLKSIPVSAFLENSNRKIDSYQMSSIQKITLKNNIREHLRLCAAKEGGN